MIETADDLLWERLRELERRHQHVRARHEESRRGLDRLHRQGDADLRLAWQDYCRVVEELDQVTAEFEVLQSARQ